MLSQNTILYICACRSTNSRKEQGHVTNFHEILKKEITVNDSSTKGLEYSRLRMKEISTKRNLYQIYMKTKYLGLDKIRDQKTEIVFV